MATLLPAQRPQNRPSITPQPRLPETALRTPTVTPVATPTAAALGWPGAGEMARMSTWRLAAPAGGVTPWGTTTTRVASRARRAEAYSLLEAVPVHEIHRQTHGD